MEEYASDKSKNEKDEEVLIQSLENPRLFENLVQKYQDGF